MTAIKRANSDDEINSYRSEPKWTTKTKNNIDSRKAYALTRDKIKDLMLAKII